MSHAHNATVVGATACEMSMLWNWQTVDTCFLSESWHVTSRGMFAASCIGVAFLSVANEALRRFCREYDQLVMRQLGEVMEQRNNGPPNPLWFIDSYNHGPPRATAFQQLIRTILHVMSVGVGYILMLVLMSFNGYTFISILIGTGIGKFFSDWLTVGQAEYNVCLEEETDKAQRPRHLSQDAGRGHHH